MRTLLRAEVDIAAPASEVWGYVTDWPRQGEWIPFTRVSVVGPGAGQGVGGRVRARTGIGPVGFWDPMTVTTWEVEAGGSARCGVLHTGAVVRGDGEFAVQPTGPGASHLAWWERVDVPGGPPGALLWRLARPFAQRGLEATLRRLRRRLEGPQVSRGG